MRVLSSRAEELTGEKAAASTLIGCFLYGWLRVAAEWLLYWQSKVIMSQDVFKPFNHILSLLFMGF
jgi:hypothetical protein